MQITRYTALGVCLELLEAQTRILSCDFTKLEPREGCEAMWGFFRTVEKLIKAMLVENMPSDMLRKDAKQKKGAVSHDEAGANSGTAGKVGGNVDGGEPHTGAVEGAPGADGNDCGFCGSDDAPAGVLDVEVTPHQPPRAAASPRVEATGDLLPPPAGGTPGGRSLEQWSEAEMRNTGCEANGAQGLQREAKDDKPPLLDRLNGILIRDMPEHVATGRQPPWADAAMQRASMSEQKGQISFI